ncbi:MAG: biopolymer transporter ExbD [Steroidobacteraceae bacterium]|jgi:biopolymer transport protein ExbD
MTSLRMRQRGRRRGGRGAGGGHGPLALVPMIDMLTILVVYLLVHAADYEILPNTKNIAIPQSVSEAKPRESVTLLVTRDTVYVNGAAVVPLEVVRTSEGSVVEPLVVALRGVGGRDMVSGRTDRREVTVLADRELPYSVMRRIMSSASAADYTAVSLAVIEKARAAAAIG